MSDKNKLNLIHFEFFFFAVPSYFRSASIIEGLPHKQDSKFLKRLHNCHISLLDTERDAFSEMSATACNVSLSFSPCTTSRRDISVGTADDFLGGFGV